MSAVSGSRTIVHSCPESLHAPPNSI